MRPHRITPIHPAGRSSSTTTLSPKRCLIQNGMAALSISTTKSAETNWCFMGTFFIRTSRLVTIWRRQLPVIFKLPATSRWRFRRHAPGPTLGGPSYVETGVPMGAFNPFNPFQQIISGGTRARLIEFGNRVIDNETNAFFSTLGLKGDKLFDGSWGYDASFRYSQVQNISTAHSSQPRDSTAF